MECPSDQRPIAWQPLTPRGVGAFANATFGRVFVVQLVVAALAAGTVVWLLSTAWFPVIGSAIERLPPEAHVSSGRLVWPKASPELLAENRFLALAVDLPHAAQARSLAHVQVEFGRTDIRFYSLLGCLPVPYPQDYFVAFNYPEVKPWWGARAPVFLALAALVTVLALILTWAVLACVYTLPAWLVGLYANRQLTILGSWRVAAAGQLPGALFLSAALVWYGLGHLDLVRLLTAFVLHLAVGWAYLVLGALATPKLPTPSLRSNPFQGRTPAAAPNVADTPETSSAKAVSPPND
jgi:hypothetical protein